MQILHGAKICPAADILARHTPHLLVLIRFFGQNGVVILTNKAKMRPRIGSKLEIMPYAGPLPRFSRSMPSLERIYLGTELLEPKKSS